ncbi:iron-sulfur cluster binding protein [Archaeoglobus fulgidus DSM 4304]|uniref:Iron-sulfur cluster binding protein n=1 Tax=Archaeoglobus fulgidus (strain ATCC 49558 / DSM 4304 / JCM 9628 / NBRC 100126 / VC-16) TaxID=224325 RepID=O29082_ARCFU|nr:iron-sulfur cluster binding protein [Archaeoglobus fulgidus DSM 4304]
MIIVKLLLRFDSKTVTEPVLSKATLKTGTLINILRASVGARRGEILIEVDDEKAKEVESFLKEQGVEVIELLEAVQKDDEKCVHCGACVSICPTEAIYINGDKRVAINTEKCVHCGSCVKVCPTRALSLPL